MFKSIWPFALIAVPLGVWIASRALARSGQRSPQRGFDAKRGASLPGQDIFSRGVAKPERDGGQFEAVTAPYTSHPPPVVACRIPERAQPAIKPATVLAAPQAVEPASLPHKIDCIPPMPVAYGDYETVEAKRDPLLRPYRRQPTRHARIHNGEPRYHNRPTTLYYVRLNFESRILYKVGITTSYSVYTRFRKEGLRCTVLRAWTFKTGARAYGVEQMILSVHFRDRYKGPNILKAGGNSELFVSDILGIDGPDVACKTVESPKLAKDDGVKAYWISTARRKVETMQIDGPDVTRSIETKYFGKNVRLINLGNGIAILYDYTHMLENEEYEFFEVCGRRHITGPAILIGYRDRRFMNVPVSVEEAQKVVRFYRGLLVGWSDSGSDGGCEREAADEHGEITRAGWPLDDGLRNRHGH